MAFSAKGPRSAGLVLKATGNAPFRALSRPTGSNILRVKSMSLERSRHFFPSRLPAYEGCPNQWEFQWFLFRGIERSSGWRIEKHMVRLVDLVGLMFFPLGCAPSGWPNHLQEVLHIPPLQPPLRHVRSQDSLPCVWQPPLRPWRQKLPSWHSGELHVFPPSPPWLQWLLLPLLLRSWRLLQAPVGLPASFLGHLPHFLRDLVPLYPQPQLRCAGQASPFERCVCVCVCASSLPAMPSLGLKKACHQIHRSYIITEDQEGRLNHYVFLALNSFN